MSNRKRVERLARYLSPAIDRFILLISDEDGNLIDHDGQIVTEEQLEARQAATRLAVIDLQKED